MQWSCPLNHEETRQEMSPITQSKPSWVKAFCCCCRHRRHASVPLSHLHDVHVDAPIQNELIEPFQSAVALQTLNQHTIVTGDIESSILLHATQAELPTLMSRLSTEQMQHLVNKEPNHERQRALATLLAPFMTITNALEPVGSPQDSSPAASEKSDV